MKAAKNPDYSDRGTANYSALLKEFKGEFKGTLHGGETPDMADIAVYGFMTPGLYSECNLYAPPLP